MEMSKETKFDYHENKHTYTLCAGGTKETTPSRWEETGSLCVSLLSPSSSCKCVRPSENRTRDRGIVECRRQPSVPIHQARRWGIVLGWGREDTKKIVYKGRR